MLATKFMKRSPYKALAMPMGSVVPVAMELEVRHQGLGFLGDEKWPFHIHVHDIT